MSIFTVLPANKVESTPLILVGGALSLVVGALYVAFEKSLLARRASSSDDVQLPAAPADHVDVLSKIVLGVQVGLVALAMLVTRSSVASLQAKLGLPLGVQVVGWVTLGESILSLFADGCRVDVASAWVVRRVQRVLSKTGVHPLLTTVLLREDSLRADCTRTAPTSRRFPTHHFMH